ncbi:MAG: methyltransferase domain-containing protein [Phycisphaerales bacterium]
MSAYDAAFFAGQQAGSEVSAHAVIPLIRELVRFSSVADVGCGTGAWLKAFAQSGTSDYHGFDGRWALDAGLLIPADRFTPADLAHPPSPPRRFDLALSLEVAEHLPEASADAFIDFLTRLAPVVVFSAAIPGQGGTDHLNEQWPDYWATRFTARGFVCVDALRPRLWDDQRVRWWYAQNTLVYVARDHLVEQPALTSLLKEHPALPSIPLSLVHPECYRRARKPLSVRGLIKELPRAFGRAVARRFGRRP